MAAECPLLQLPKEALTAILLRCTCRELVHLSATCRAINETVQDDIFWRSLAAKEYSVTEVTGAVNDTFKKLYQRLLHPFGWMIGLHWSRIEYYGGILEIQVVGDSIVGNSIRMSDEGVLLVSKDLEVCAATNPATQLCTKSEKHHFTRITRDEDGKSLVQKCQFHDRRAASQSANSLQELRAKTFRDAHRLGIVHEPLVVPGLPSVPAELLPTQQQDTNISNIANLNIADTVGTATESAGEVVIVDPPASLPEHVLMPGLYSSDFNPHGYEIFVLDYKDRDVTLVKILGDHYVPSGKVSIKFSLNYSFKLTGEQQAEMTTTQMIEREPQISSHPLNLSQEQPFQYPPFCSPVSVNTDAPTTCYARYDGYGQLANEFYTDAAFSRVHVIVFNSRQMGVLFLELNAFMMFHRIDRQFGCPAPVGC